MPLGHSRSLIDVFYTHYPNGKIVKRSCAGITASILELLLVLNTTGKNCHF